MKDRRRIEYSTIGLPSINIKVVVSVLTTGVSHAAAVTFYKELCQSGNANNVVCVHTHQTWY